MSVFKIDFFPNSSMVEHLAVNEAVLGSSPSLGADRGVAQPGSALALGARCRRFDSCYPDQFLVRWLSGLKQEFTKLSMSKIIRGFESYSHRIL